MKINGLKLAPAEPTPTPEESKALEQQKAKAEALKVDLAKAYAKLKKGKDYYEYLPLEEQAKIESMMSQIQGEVALLDAFIETGVWQNPGSNFADSDIYTKLPDLEPGWHGNSIQYLDSKDKLYKEYATQVATEGNSGKLTNVIMLPAGVADTGNPLDSTAGLVLKPGDSLVGKSVGEDIWFTITHKDGSIETQIIKKPPPDVPLFISAQQADEGVKIDLSGVVRANDGKSGKFGDTSNGFIIIGSQHDDIIIGSGSGDTIIGWGGNDKIYGMGGIDKIFGDGVTKVDGQLISVNSIGGNDYIDGGTGADAIYAGGGADDYAVSDLLEQDTILEAENTVQLEDVVDPAEAKKFGDSIKLEGGWASKYDSDASEVVISNDKPVNGNAVTITAPDGYTMVSGTDQGNDMVLTFVKMDLDKDGDPTPVYLRVRIKDVLSLNNQTKVEIKACDASYGGSIIDLSEISSGSNKVILTGNDAVDTLIGPTANLDEVGIKASDITGASTITIAELNETIKKTKDSDGKESITKWGGDNWSSAEVENKEIILTPKKDADLTVITFADLPTGLKSVDGVYYKVEGKDLVVYAFQVNDAGSGEFDMVAIRIKDAVKEGKIPTVVIGGRTAEAIGSTEFNGGGGADFIVGNIGSTTSWGGDSSDTIQKGWKIKNTKDTSKPDMTTDTDKDGVPDYYEIPGGTEKDASKKPAFWNEEDKTKET